MDEYRPQGVVFLAIEQNNGNAGNVSSVQAYATQFGWDFPIGLNNTGVGGNLFSGYETERHNYFIIDAEGRIAFRAEGGGYTGTAWSSYEPRIKAAIDELLAVPVEDVTWTGIKALYR